eukprot:TRINITY_DN12375_c0_g1_i2.p3 TRINITY_DN12375_c0_g1~~TRINITY_DN12375_c0_g1_i2.p3  ORF type:complete len:341 (+),score=49.48 TRINITY_DN12375_c0_g1_i2:3185-4207(+)
MELESSRAFDCPKCTRTFLRADHLSYHLLAHCPRKAFVCAAEGCNKRFTYKATLVRHQRTCNHDDWLFDVQSLRTAESVVKECFLSSASHKMLSTCRARLYDSLNPYIKPTDFLADHTDKGGAGLATSNKIPGASPGSTSAPSASLLGQSAPPTHQHYASMSQQQLPASLAALSSAAAIANYGSQAKTPYMAFGMNSMMGGMMGGFPMMPGMMPTASQPYAIPSMQMPTFPPTMAAFNPFFARSVAGQSGPGPPVMGPYNPMAAMMQQPNPMQQQMQAMQQQWMQQIQAAALQSLTTTASFQPVATKVEAERVSQDTPSAILLAKTAHGSGDEENSSQEA